jgi:hypothetical protein
MSGYSMEAWTAAAEDILSALVMERYVDERDAYFRQTYYEHGLTPDDMPPGQCSTLYAVIIDLYRERREVNAPAVMTRMSNLNQAWYYSLSVLFDDMRRMDYASLIRLCKEYGAKARAITVLERGAVAIKQGAAVGDAMRSVVSNISTESAATAGETADAVAGDITDWLEGTPEKLLSTGIDWLDAETGGIEKGAFYGLAGAYKSRKSTLGYNILLNAARAGESVAILSLENSRLKMGAIMTVMLAVDHLFYTRRDYTPNNPLYWMSAKQLLNARASYRTWRKEKVEAIEVGLSKWRALQDRIRLYDMTREGGLHGGSISTVVQCIKRDQHLYGGWLYMVDHMLLIERALQNQPYLQQTVVSGALRELVRQSGDQPLSVLLLAQMNETSIRNGNMGASGVKGGGALAADVDTLLETRGVVEMDDKFYNDRSQVRIQRGRDTASTGWNTVMYHDGSGLILPSKTVKFPDVMTVSTATPAHDEMLDTMLDALEAQ